MFISLILVTLIMTLQRLDNRNLKFFKKYSIITQCKALNERISEWAYFLNLDGQFQRYLYFSAPKKGGFCEQELKGELHTYLEWHQKHDF